MKKLYKYIILLFPTIFISILIDAYYVNKFGYILLLAHLAYITIKYDNKTMLFSGLFTTIFSFFLAMFILDGKYYSYFNPLIPSSLAIAIGLFVINIQIFLKLLFSKKKDDNISK